MNRRKRMTLFYRGGPFNGQSENMLVGRYTAGIVAHEYQDDKLVSRHRYVIERVEGRPIHLAYAGAASTPPEERSP